MRLQRRSHAVSLPGSTTMFFTLDNDLILRYPLRNI